MSENKSCCQVAGPAPPSDDRRLVVKILAGAVGAVATLFPVVAGLVTFADPATRRERRFRDPKNPTGGRTEDGFLRVASLSEVPADGTPLRVTITDDVTNKWTFSPGEPVGEVFLRKTKGNANEEQVTAWTTVCPHLGCSISLVRGEEGKPVFRCPCHNSVKRWSSTAAVCSRPSASTRAAANSIASAIPSSF